MTEHRSHAAQLDIYCLVMGQRLPTLCTQHVQQGGSVRVCAQPQQQQQIQHHRPVSAETNPSVMMVNLTPLQQLQ